jgi:REP element-mobilizing transposase RayT
MLKAWRKWFDTIGVTFYPKIMGQSLHQVYGHIVFSTKDRKNLIISDIEPELYKYICGIIHDLDGRVISINGMPDHVHILFRASKKVADVDFIRQVKGSSSKWMNEKVKGSSWQSGYGWFGVSARDLDKAIAYVENQKEHHKTISFQDELRRILTVYKIPYDEQYLWD